MSEPNGDVWFGGGAVQRPEAISARHGVNWPISYSSYRVRTIVRYGRYDSGFRYRCRTLSMGGSGRKPGTGGGPHGRAGECRAWLAAAAGLVRSPSRGRHGSGLS